MSADRGDDSLSMSTINRLCPVCDQVIAPDAPVSLLHGELLHKECFEATMGAQKPRRSKSRPNDGANGQQ